MPKSRAPLKGTGHLIVQGGALVPKSRVLEVSYSGSERANVVGFMRGLIRDRLRLGTHDLACEALLHSTSLLAHNIYIAEPIIS